jgi:hypothetical protein
MSQKNDNRKKLSTILAEPLSKQRIMLTTRIAEAQNPDNPKAFTADDLQALFATIDAPRDSFKREVDNVMEALKTGKAPFEPNLRNPENQFIWGAALQFLSVNPEVMAGWQTPLTPDLLTKSNLWEQIRKSRDAIEELLAHAYNIRETLRDRDTKYIWGGPGSKVSYNRQKNAITIDLSQVMVMGFEHARADVNRVVAESLLSVKYPKKMQDLYRELAPLLKRAQQAQSKKAPKLSKDDYKKLRTLSAEWQLRMMMFNAGEENAVNRYVSNLGQKTLQDFSVSLNNTAVTGRGIGLGGLDPMGLDAKDAYKRYMNLANILMLHFYQKNNLFENTDEAWRSVGTYPDFVRTTETLKKRSPNDPPADGEGVSHPDFKYFRSLGERLEKALPKGAARLFGQERFEREINRAADERNKIIEEIWEKFGEELLQDIMNEVKEQLEEQMKNQQEQDGDEQDQDGDDQDQDNDQEGQQGQKGQKGKKGQKGQKGQKGEPSDDDGDQEDSDDQEGDDQDADQENQSGQKQKQQKDGKDQKQKGQKNKGEKDKGEKDKGEKDKGEKDKGDQAQDQEGDDQKQKGEPSDDQGDDQSGQGDEQEADGQDQDGQSEEGKLGADDDSKVPVDGMGDMPGVEGASENPEDARSEKDGQDQDGQDGEDGQEGDQDADADNGQEGQDGQGQTMEDLQKALEKAQQEAEADAQGQEGDQQSKQKAQQKKSDKAGTQDGRDLADLAKQDWTQYDKRIAELQEPIQTVRKIFKKVQERQLEEKKQISSDLDIIPENGELLERFNTEAHKNLVIKSKLGTVEEADYKRFHKDETVTTPTEIDVVLMIDGSGSMGQASFQGGRSMTPLDSALQTAAILFEATSGQDMAINVYVVMWGHRDKHLIQVPIKPGASRVEVGRAMQAMRSGLNSGTDMAPAIEKVVETIAEQRGKSGTLSGFTHIINLSDGDISDATETTKKLKEMFTYTDKVTFDTALIGGRKDSDMAKASKAAKGTKPQHDVGVLYETDPNKIPMAITGLLLDKIRKLGSFKAVPNAQKRRELKKASHEMNKRKR